jgi:nucleotide-binding universal stress UspA family protein
MTTELAASSASATNPAAKPNESGLIIVGVDGSQESMAALLWAMEEARLRGARVRAVNAWDYPVGVGIELTPTTLYSYETMQQASESVLGNVVDKAYALVKEPPLVERCSKQGPAAMALLAEAKGADLLVVGTRGHGGFRGLLLGSVADRCARHAVCPTVVIPSVES